jgi:hypothetical protein
MILLVRFGGSGTRELELPAPRSLAGPRGAKRAAQTSGDPVRSERSFLGGFLGVLARVRAVAPHRGYPEDRHGIARLHAQRDFSAGNSIRRVQEEIEPRVTHGRAASFRLHGRLRELESERDSLPPEVRLDHGSDLLGGLTTAAA